MIPYIIGGVALAATGYGIKKYLEEEVKEDSSILEEYKNIKLSLEKTTLKEMQNALKEIKNLNLPAFKTSGLYENYKNKYLLLDKSNIPLIEEFINILSNAKTMQDILLNKLDRIIIECGDYQKCSEGQKIKIQKALTLYQATQDAMNIPLSYDGISVNRTVRRAFTRLKKLAEAEVI